MRHIKIILHLNRKKIEESKGFFAKPFDAASRTFLDTLSNKGLTTYIDSLHSQSQILNPNVLGSYVKGSFEDQARTEIIYNPFHKRWFYDLCSTEDLVTDNLTLPSQYKDSIEQISLSAHPLQYQKRLESLKKIYSPQAGHYTIFIQKFNPNIIPKLTDNIHVMALSMDAIGAALENHSLTEYLGTQELSETVQFWRKVNSSLVLKPVFESF